MLGDIQNEKKPILVSVYCSNIIIGSFWYKSMLDTFLQHIAATLANMAVVLHPMYALVTLVTPGDLQYETLQNQVTSDKTNCENSPA